MAVKSLDILRGFFETGDKPTKEQFWDFLDSYIHKIDGVTIPDVSGLVAALANKADVSALAIYATKSKAMVSAADTAALASLSVYDSGFVLVRHVGLFSVFDTGSVPVDVVITYASADAGKVWGLILAESTGGDLLLDKIADLEANTDNSIGNFSVLEENRGGEFLKYTGTQIADGGVIFEDANGTKWKRVIRDNYINVKWWDIVENTAMDAIWVNIMAAASNKENIASPRIYFPANFDNTKFYKFNNTIIIDAKVEIFGDGPTSKLRWDVNVPGIVTNYVTSRGSWLKNIVLDGGSGASPAGSPLGSNWSATQYGLEAKDIIHCEGVTFRYWASDGVHLYGNATLSTNVNNSTFYLCDASENRRHGFYVQGPDANAILFEKCDAITNGGVGFYDTSFLGNHYIHNHSASNGSPEAVWQRGLVKNGTNVYACVVDGTIGIEPGVTPGWQTNWVLTGKAWSGYAPVKVYDAAVTYYQVCAYNLNGVNQYGTFIGNYAESDQAYSWISNRNIAIGTNFALRTGSATVLQANGPLFSTDEFWAGNPGDFTTNRSFIAPRGIGVTKAGGTGIVIGYDSTRNVAEVKNLTDIEGAGGSMRITTGATTAANIGRTAASVGGKRLWLPHGVFVNSQQNRTGATRYWDSSMLENPTTTGSDIGDLWLISTTNPNLSAPPEVAMVKYISSTSGSTPKLLSISARAEEAVTVAGTHTMMSDYNITTGKGVLYDIIYTGGNATDDCILHHQILLTNKAGTLTLINDTALRTDLKPGTFATTAINLAISTNNVTIQVINLPENTVGKISVHRMKFG